MKGDFHVTIYPDGTIPPLSLSQMLALRMTIRGI